MSASMSVMMCRVCGKMAESDTAVALNPHPQTLFNGCCSCVFHPTCVSNLRTSTYYECGFCRARALSVINLTGRNCLLCACYSKNILCTICQNTVVETILQALSCTESVCVGDILMDFQMIRTSFGPHRELFMAWICHLLRISALPFVLLEENGFYNARKRTWLMFELWRKCLLQQTVIDLNMFIEDPMLLIWFPNPSQCLRQCLELDNPAFQIENGEVRSCQRQRSVGEDLDFVKGKDLATAGLLEMYEKRVEVGRCDRLFLPLDNDFLYFPKIISEKVLDVNLEQWQSAHAEIIYSTICLKTSTNENKNDIVGFDCE